METLVICMLHRSLRIQVFFKLHVRLSEEIQKAHNVSVVQHYVLFQQLIYLYKAIVTIGRLILAL